MYRKAVGALALAASLSVAGCGGGTDLEDALSEAEAEALAEALFMNTFDNTETEPQPQAGAAFGVPVSFSWDVAFTGECELGGTVDVEGSASYEGDSETQEASIDYSVTQVHHDCVVEAESSDHQFTLNGSPNLTAGYTLHLGQEGAFELDGSIAGGVQWETEGRAGVCTVAVGYSASGNLLEETGEFVMEGTVCGASINAEVSVG